METQSRDRIEIRRASSILEDTLYYLEEIDRKIQNLNKNSKTAEDSENGFSKLHSMAN